MDSLRSRWLPTAAITQSEPASCHQSMHGLGPRRDICLLRSQPPHFPTGCSTWTFFEKLFPAMAWVVLTSLPSLEWTCIATGHSKWPFSWPQWSVQGGHIIQPESVINETSADFWETDSLQSLWTEAGHSSQRSCLYHLGDERGKTTRNWSKHQRKKEMEKETESWSDHWSSGPSLTLSLLANKVC